MSSKIAYVALHYGADYLAWAIRSIQDAVDEIHILYTNQPSFGYETTLSCPDSEADLRREAERFLKKPIFWHYGNWKSESAQRNEIFGIARDRGASQALVLDADELWPPGLAVEALAAASGRSEQNVLMRFIHFWRSLHWVCRDPAMPVRILNIGGTGTWYLSPQRAPILHMGYAQRSAVVDYKWHIHGHRGEWRGNWYEEKFAPWKPGRGMKDVHPTNVDFWNPEPVNSEENIFVNHLLLDHPYHALEMIP